MLWKTVSSKLFHVVYCYQINLMTFYLDWKSQENCSVRHSETLARISPNLPGAVILLFYRGTSTLQLLNLSGVKTTGWMPLKLNPQVDQSIFNAVSECQVHGHTLSWLIFSPNWGQCCTYFQACRLFFIAIFFSSKSPCHCTFRFCVKRLFVVQQFSGRKELTSRGSTLNASGNFLCEIRLINKVFSVVVQSPPIYLHLFFFSSIFFPFPKPDTQAVKVSLTGSYRYFDGI